MIPPTIAAALLALASGGAATAEHRVTLDHRDGPVEVRYAGDVRIHHAQIGSVAPGGRPATLRCAWRADAHVQRDAHQPASGRRLVRALPATRILAGTRPGWCDGHARAIAAEVATRHDRLRDHLQAAAADDRATLHAELDHHGAERQGG